MIKNRINIQLFGDPTGDPQPTAPNPTGPGANPGPSGADATPNDADLLLEFKKNHVTREEYLKEKERADSYLKAILENREAEIAAAEGAEKKVDAKAIAQEMFVEDNSMSDIEYVTKALQLRKARIDAGERDPFLPDNYDDKDMEIAENVADVFEDCIKLANGDNASFIALLQSRMKDPTIGFARKNIRR